MKKIENLFTLFFTYIGPKQIPELALMNSKKHSGEHESLSVAYLCPLPPPLLDFLKHEDLSMEEEIADSQVRDCRANSGKQNSWNCDINNSMNMFPFNSIHPQPPPSHESYNGGDGIRLNASNIMDSSVAAEGKHGIHPPPLPAQSLSLMDNDD